MSAIIVPSILPPWSAYRVFGSGPDMLGGPDMVGYITVLGLDDRYKIWHVVFIYFVVVVVVVARNAERQIVVGMLKKAKVEDGGLDLINKIRVSKVRT